MTWEAAPWLIEGGVKHSANVARSLALAAIGGHGGVLGPTHCRVDATSPASAGVVVLPGACGIPSNAQDALAEAYIAINRTNDSVGIAATGGSARTDLVVVRVENPFPQGEPWTEPSAQAIEDGTAVFPYSRVISGVDPAAAPESIVEGLGYSALPLAFIDMPANTSVVQQSYIRDVRSLPQPRRADSLHIAAATNEAVRDLTASDFTEWINELRHTVRVPPWATHAQIMVTLGGVLYGAGGDNGGAGWDVNGALRGDLGTLDGDSTVYNVSVDASTDRTTLITGTANLVLPTWIRGVDATFRLRGKKNAGSTSLRANAGTIGSVHILFTEQPT